MFKEGRKNVHAKVQSGQPSVLMILFKVLLQKIVKGGVSQFQNFCVNLHKFHALFTMRLSQLG
jgi:hypothetical protein